MTWKTSTTLATCAAALLALRGAAAARHRSGPSLPLAATVHLPLEQLRADDLPAPLAALGRGVTITCTAAPGDRGTEIRVQPGSGRRAARARARLALRQAKELLETGELHPPDEPVTRRRTLVSAPLETAIRRAGRAGRL